jgi:hypothetical protein
MDTQAHHLNTLKIKRSQVRELIDDLKRMKIRHRPFNWHGDELHVQIYSTTKYTWLALKYS